MNTYEAAPFHFTTDSRESQVPPRSEQLAHLRIIVREQLTNIRQAKGTQDRILLTNVSIQNKRIQCIEQLTTTE
jgi:hypothetical protein